jgi:asparagine synthase (glutamine-hydrolysing)
MCGINGIFAYHEAASPVSRDELLLTRDQMFLRGPDGCGLWISRDGRIGLGHRRLAIIDLSEGGLQPMTTVDGRLSVVFNGEIYNYQELRQKLILKGAHFQSKSDTEVLLHLYDHYGADMVNHLRGMFSFAVWDEIKEELFLARDAYGIKPLYYSDDGKVFRFGSQVKALLSGGAISKEFDPAGIVGFLLWGSVPEPFTVYRDIMALPAGSMMKVTRSGPECPKPYWNLADTIVRSVEASKKIIPGEEREYMRTALLDSVKAHMVSDVPVGAFLSGGIDSSSVVSLVMEVSSNPLETLTLAFDEFKGKTIDELPIARKIAAHLGVSHQCINMSMQEVENDIPAFLSAMDQPTIDGINTWSVSKAASKAGFKVVVSGVGGDELLGGYSSFREVPEIVRAKSIPGRIPFLGDIFQKVYSTIIFPYTSLSPRYAGLFKNRKTYEWAYQLVRGVFMPWELHKILNRDYAREGLRRLHLCEQDSRLLTESVIDDFGKVVILESSRYMRNQLLRDTDWTGMSHSLEIRVPLVDRILTEDVVGLAITGRLGENKAILPKTLLKGLPEEALNHPKTGFTVPLWRWLRKSKEFDAWKSVNALRKSHVHDYKRWAYVVISRMVSMARMEGIFR